MTCPLVNTLCCPPLSYPNWHYHISLGCFNHPNPDPHLQSTCTQQSELSSQRRSDHATPQLGTLQWLLSALKLSRDFYSISEEEQNGQSPCSLTPLTSYLQDYECHILFLLMIFFFNFSNSSCFSFTVSSLLVFSLLLSPSSPLVTHIYQEKIFPGPTAVNQDPSRYSRNASRCYNPCPV